ncbi:MAG: hypothetical protein AAF756_04705 [Pseudomonadota bacterium]
MKAELEDFGTGWYGLFLGLDASEIEALIRALQNLQREKTHFHYRSDFDGVGGIGDITVYYRQEEQDPNMQLEDSTTLYVPPAT